MDENWLEIREYNGSGYQPLIDSASWRVAILRWEEATLAENITTMERHTQTDEVFVLLVGRAMLVLGGNSKRVDRLQPQSLEPAKLYNVRQGVWHSVLLSRDATILIVENRDTGVKNTEYYQLTQTFREEIMDFGANY